MHWGSASGRAARTALVRGQRGPRVLVRVGLCWERIGIAVRDRRVQRAARASATAALLVQTLKGLNANGLLELSLVRGEGLPSPERTSSAPLDGRAVSTMWRLLWV